MMRKWTWMMVMLCSAIAVNAAKVALIPTAPELTPVTDQVLAAMSNDSGVEFLERANIEAVLKERKLTAAGLTGSNLADLSKAIHADLFAVITAKPGQKGKKEAVVSGLIVYDARNGFRLVNVVLSEQDAVKEIVERLRQAQDIIKHPEKQILLSIVTVRDAGVPEKHKYRMAFITAELDRQLSSIPGVVMLERDYLDSVNQERKITGQMFALVPSVRLLRLEFSPGHSPEIVNLTLRITDAADKELFRFSLNNCLADTKTTAMKIIATIAEYLKVSPSNIAVSASAEAARFFAEYQFLSRLGDYAGARRKLDAAIALEPKTLDYHLAMLSLNNDTPVKSYHDMVLRQQRILNLSLEIERDFPLWHGALYSNSDYYKWDYFINQMGQATTQDLVEMKSFAEAFRPKYDAEILRIYYKFDISGGAKTYKDLTVYNRYCIDMSRFYLYFDADQWGINLCRNALQCLELSKAFFLKHPELCQKTDIDDGVSYWFLCLLEIRELRHNPNIDSKGAIEKVLRNSKEYIESAMSHPLPQTRLRTLRIDLLRKTAESNYDPEIFKDNMLEYCRRMWAIDQDECKKIDDHEINFFWDNSNPLRQISYEVHRDFVVDKRSQVPGIN